MSMVINGTSGLTMPGGQTQVGAFTSGTAVASTSGTSIDFTSIPSWVKRITVMFNGVGTSGTSLFQVQIGSGSVANTGYVSDAMYPNGPTNSGLVTTGFVQQGTVVASSNFQGASTLVLLNGNIWVSSGNIVDNAGRLSLNAGSKTLSGALDRVRITTVNGTDTFSAGSINILYE